MSDAPPPSANLKKSDYIYEMVNRQNGLQVKHEKHNLLKHETEVQCRINTLNTHQKVWDNKCVIIHP